MKKIFDTNENIADKAFMQSIVVSVLGIVLCIVALCSATYAWFVADISSSQNTISAAYFDLKVEVYDVTNVLAAMTTMPATEGEATTEGETSTEGQQPAAPTPIQLVAEYGVYTLEAGHTYVVMLTIPEGVTASRGYCDILVDGITVCRTQTIENVGENEVQFTIKMERKASMMAQPKWGVPADNGVQTIANGQTFTIAATGSAAVVPATNPAVPETTNPETTAPSTEPTEPATEPTEPATEPTDPESNIE